MAGKKKIATNMSGTQDAAAEGYDKSPGGASIGASAVPETPTPMFEQDRDAVLVRAFNPDRGTAVIEFRKRRWRYTQERTAEQVIAMADYLRARRGFSSDQEMAEVLGVHRTRLAAWKRGADVPNPQNAQLLSHLAVVVTEVQEFLDPDVISDWLLTEQYTLSGRTPVRALREGMLAEVLHTANAAEHGAYI
jgi:transcriptional regulator with XRE-family HTH domain